MIPHVRSTLTAILGLSAATLIISAIWASNMTELLAVFDDGRPSTALVSPQFYTRLTRTNGNSLYSTMIFYAGAMPLVSILWAVIDIFLSLAASISPLHALASAILFFCCWIAQISVWISCQVTPNSQGISAGHGWCPNAGIPKNVQADSMNSMGMITSYGAVADKTNTLGLMRSIFGIVVATGVAAYVVLAGVAVEKSKRVKRSETVNHKSVALG